MIDLDAIEKRNELLQCTNMNAQASELVWQIVAHARIDIPALVAEVERLQCELHDEQVRCSEWKKMYNQAVEDNEIE